MRSSAINAASTAKLKSLFSELRSSNSSVISPSNSRLFTERSSSTTIPLLAGLVASLASITHDNDNNSQEQKPASFNPKGAFYFALGYGILYTLMFILHNKLNTRL